MIACRVTRRRLYGFHDGTGVRVRMTTCATFFAQISKSHSVIVHSVVGPVQKYYGIVASDSGGSGKSARPHHGLRTPEYICIFI